MLRPTPYGQRGPASGRYGVDTSTHLVWRAVCTKVQNAVGRMLEDGDTTGMSAVTDRIDDRTTLMATAVTEPGGIPVGDAPLPPLASPLNRARVDAAAKRAFDIAASTLMLLAL